MMSLCTTWRLSPRFTTFHQVTVRLVELVVDVMVEVSEVVVAQDLQCMAKENRLRRVINLIPYFN